LDLTPDAGQAGQAESPSKDPAARLPRADSIAWLPIVTRARLNHLPDGVSAGEKGTRAFENCLTGHLLRRSVIVPVQRSRTVPQRSRRVGGSGGKSLAVAVPSAIFLASS